MLSGITPERARRFARAARSLAGGDEARGHGDNNIVPADRPSAPLHTHGRSRIATLRVTAQPTHGLHELSAIGHGLCAYGETATTIRLLYDNRDRAGGTEWRFVVRQEALRRSLKVTTLRVAPIERLKITFLVMSWANLAHQT